MRTAGSWLCPPVERSVGVAGNVSLLTWCGAGKSVSLSHRSRGARKKGCPLQSSRPDIFYQASAMALVHFHAYMEAFLTLEPQREKVECWFLVFLFPNPHRHTYHASWLAVTGEARAAQSGWPSRKPLAAGPGLPSPPPSCLCHWWCRPLAFLGVGVCHFSNKGSKCASRKPPEICSSHLCLRLISTDCGGGKSEYLPRSPV